MLRFFLLERGNAFGDMNRFFAYGALFRPLLLGKVAYFFADEQFLRALLSFFFFHRSLLFRKFDARIDHRIHQVGKQRSYNREDGKEHIIAHNERNIPCLQSFVCL